MEILIAVFSSFFFFILYEVFRRDLIGVLKMKVNVDETSIRSHGAFIDLLPLHPRILNPFFQLDAAMISTNHVT